MEKPVNQREKKSKPIKILLHIPVPWVYVLTYLVSLIPQLVFPIVIHSRKALTIIKITGDVFFVTGVFFALWSLIIFHKARTTTTPGETSDKLVMSGPYRTSRNPMYVSLILAYLGEAGFLSQVWPVIFLPLILIYVNRVVIPLEEEVLKQDFKEEYENYCLRVHRWL
jgi:protein-S-isoprenylcysteine O-methyltransferase Ste14